MLFIMSNAKKKSYFIRRLRLFLKRNYAVLIAVPVIAALYFYTLHIEPDSLRIKEYTFQHRMIPEKLDGCVIAFITDIHYNQRRADLWEKACNVLNNRSDLVLILQGGDIINANGKGLNINEALKKLKKLQNTNLLYNIPGNHEYRYRHGGIKAIQKTFQEHGLNLMQDKNTIITTPSGGKFNLIGLDFMTNPHKRIDRERTAKLFKNDMLNIVLPHTPEDFPHLPENAHLVLAGHTHGGQINIPFFGSAINPPGYPRKYSYGRIREDGKTMLVSSGLGSAYTQGRLCMKPEIVFITLKSADKK